MLYHKNCLVGTGVQQHPTQTSDFYTDGDWCLPSCNSIGPTP